MNWQDIIDLFSKGIPLSALEIISALIFSLLGSTVILLMYKYFYDKESIGAGVHRSFLLLGPSITAVFLGIQFSLPLSLGLLGALSIIRFRTPVKDPAEIGFIMLLIAISICCATFNYLLIGILFIIALIALFGLRIARKGASSRTSLIVTFDGPDYAKLEGKVTSFVSSKLRGTKLESISTLPDATSLYYRFDKREGFPWGEFTEELEKALAPVKVNVYIG